MNGRIAISTTMGFLVAGALGITLLIGNGHDPSPVALTVSTRALSSPPASAAALTSSREPTPIRIRIPSIDVNAKVMPLGLQGDGSLQVPPNSYLTGWFTGGPRPGAIGPSVIVGHVHWNGKWGVFEHLSEMLPGDLISVSRADSTTATFRVTRVAHFKKTRFPTNLVYGNVDHAALRLVTCSGYSSGKRAYLENVIVFAQRVDIPDPQWGLTRTSRPLTSSAGASQSE